MWLMMQKINNLIQEIYSCDFKYWKKNKKTSSIIFYKEVIVMDEKEEVVMTEEMEIEFTNGKGEEE